MVEVQNGTPYSADPSAPGTAMTVLLALLALFAAPSCDAPGHTYGDRPTACEVREIALPATGALVVDNGVSGSVSVGAWDRDEVSVVATLRAYGSDERSPTELLAATTIETDGGVRNVTRGGGWVEVAYRVRVPRATGLTVETRNGSIAVEGVVGRHRLTTRNGSLRLADVGGDVRAETANGSVTVVASGGTWEGDGLDVSTRNGNVLLEVPATYDALVEASTRYGSISDGSDDGRWARETSRQYLGAGGPTLRLSTGMGRVLVTRS